MKRSITILFACLFVILQQPLQANEPSDTEKKLTDLVRAHLAEFAPFANQLITITYESRPCEEKIKKIKAKRSLWARLNLWLHPSLMGYPQINRYNIILARDHNFNEYPIETVLPLALYLGAFSITTYYYPIHEWLRDFFSELFGYDRKFSKRTGLMKNYSLSSSINFTDEKLLDLVEKKLHTRKLPPLLPEIRKVKLIKLPANHKQS